MIGPLGSPWAGQELLDLEHGGLSINFLQGALTAGYAWTLHSASVPGFECILLREGDRNVFIAECKFWKGPKGFGEAVDQLLGYATWRDSKTAILVFNRGTETSTVLSGIDATVKAHVSFKRSVTWQHESGFRYVLHSKDDTNRELIMTVLVFHVPK